MTVLTDSGFGDYRRRVFRYYEEKKYNEALAVAREASRRFPESDAMTTFWIACLQNLLGHHDEAIHTLQRATGRGVWWPRSTLQDSDLNSIRDRPDFRKIEEECKSLQQQTPKIAKPELMVRVPTDYSDGRDYPALMVFHARYGERPEISAEEWLPVISTGTILAAPWSSQVYASDGRCWDDLELAERDVKWTFDEFRRLFPTVGDMRITETWAGYIDATPDAIPVIGPVDRPRGFVFATGFSGHGFGLGPIAGRLAAELAADGKTSLDIRGFRFSRFAEGAIGEPRSVL